MPTETIHVNGVRCERCVLRLGAALEGQEAWDAIRDAEGPFELPKTRAAWEAAAQARPDLAARARDLAALASGVDARSICSYGVGNALLELHLSQLLPDVDLTCTEFAPRTAARLRELFPEARIVEHDLLRDQPVDADLQLLHRVDTEFDDAQLEVVLRCHTRPVVLVVTGILDWPTLRSERRLRKMPDAIPAGYVRTLPALERVWKASHDAEGITIGELRGYVLRRR